MYKPRFATSFPNSVWERTPGNSVLSFRTCNGVSKKSVPKREFGNEVKIGILNQTSFLFLLLDRPQMHETFVARRTVDGFRLVRFPVAHGEAVGHDARSRLEGLLQDRPQTQVDVLPHVQ